MGELNRKSKVSNVFFFGRRIRPRGKEPDFYSIRRFAENLSILREKKGDLWVFFDEFEEKLLYFLCYFTPNSS